MPIFVPPLFLLGTVTPGLNKFAADSLGNNASVVGRLSACNTVGSILGTFLPTFVTIPAGGHVRDVPDLLRTASGIGDGRGGGPVRDRRRPGRQAGRHDPDRRQGAGRWLARAWTGTCGDTPSLGVW